MTGWTHLYPPGDGDSEEEDDEDDEEDDDEDEEEGRICTDRLLMGRVN